MNTTEMLPTQVIHADHEIVKHLGHWSTASSFDVRARYASVVIDLRSPQLPADLAVHLELAHASITILTDEHAAIDAREISWIGKGRVKNLEPSEKVGTVTITGKSEDSEIRIQRAGVAQLTAMLSRAYLAELAQTRKTGGVPHRRRPTTPHQQVAHRAAASPASLFGTLSRIL
jgi:hypothetical protein